MGRAPDVTSNLEDDDSAFRGIWHTSLALNGKATIFLRKKCQPDALLGDAATRETCRKVLHSIQYHFMETSVPRRKNEESDGLNL